MRRSSLPLDTPEAFLEVKIFSPSKTYFEGKAVSVSAKNKAGKFDILPLHHNFITLLETGVIEVTTTAQVVKEIDVNVSLLHLANGHLTIFTDV